MINELQQKTLLEIARESVYVFLAKRDYPAFDISDELLLVKAGTFVTIKSLQGELRGCIGIIDNDEKPLYKLISEMAIAAATEDSRFTALLISDLDSVVFEISVLSKPQRIQSWRDIRLTKHGVIVEKGLHRGVFLPQVAEENAWDLKTFLEILCVEKAGLAIDAYRRDKDVVIKTFEAQVFSE